MTFAIDVRSKLLNAIKFDKKHVFVHHPKTDFFENVTFPLLISLPFS